MFCEVFLKKILAVLGKVLIFKVFRVESFFKVFFWKSGAWDLWGILGVFLFRLPFPWLPIRVSIHLPLFFVHSSFILRSFSDSRTELERSLNGARTELERRMNGGWTEVERRLNGARTEVERSSNGGWTEDERRMNGGWTEEQQTPNVGVDSLSQADVVAALICGEVFFWVTATKFSRDTLDDVNGSNFCHDSSVF